jgi:hypothetical protein
MKYTKKAFALTNALTLQKLTSDFADALKKVDTDRIAHKHFCPGIGPYGEAEAVRATLLKLKEADPASYAGAVIKRLPDLLIPGEWAIEFKILRPFGDNGKAAEHWSENVMHPYVGNTSSLGDCLKLINSGLSERKAVIIFGYEHTPPRVLLDSAIHGFEVLAHEVMGVRLTPRVEELRYGLVHSVHQQLRVFAYEVLGFTTPLPNFK